MSYEETIEYLFQAAPAFEHVGASAYKPGLQTTEALDEYYGHPHRQYKTIHIAGTNGRVPARTRWQASFRKPGTGLDFTHPPT